MSLISKLGKNNENLSTILLAYEQELENARELIAIEHKTLEQANRENATWHYFYAVKKAELQALVKYFEAEVESVRGNLFKTLTKTNQRDLSDRAKDKFIDSEEAFLTINEVYLEVKEVYDKYSALVDAFVTRGYALNNITKARVAEVHNMVL